MRSSNLWIMLYSSLVYASAIFPRQTTIPAPIAFNPDQNWDGIDGSWSSFTLRIGSPSQTVRVFPSWMSYQTWAIAPQGCPNSTAGDSCDQSRGGIFNYSSSSSFQQVGLFSTWIEQNLGYEGNAVYGYDVVSLGGLGEGGPTLKNSTVGAVAVNDFYLGVFGLNPKPTNWTSYDDPAPSYMTQLKEQKLVPSVSFGYTAGAPYRFTGTLGSLTLGGYDKSRFEPGPVEFDFAADNERDTVVAIQSITTSSSKNDTQLLPTSIYALVDTTISQLWLPIEACEKFESAFGLVYDNATELYLVNSSLHASLLQQDANVTFVLAKALVGGSTVSITLPYAAFDLTAQPPYQNLANKSSYFPLRRAQNDTQYTLGRTFMQEAYITVDYERAKFNISQCSWVQDEQTQLVPIYPASSAENNQYSGAGTVTTKSTGSSLSGAGIAGIVVAAVVTVLALGLLFWAKRRGGFRAKADKAKDGGSSSSSLQDPGLGTPHTATEPKGSRVFPKAELEGSNMHKNISQYSALGTPVSPEPPAELGVGDYAKQNMNPLSPDEVKEAGGDQVYEMVGDHPMFEMAGDLPTTNLADGRQVTEKDMMKRREEMYNGVCPRPNPAVDAHSTEEVVPGQEDDGPPKQIIQAGEVVLKDELGIGCEANVDPQHARFSFEN